MRVDEVARRINESGVFEEDRPYVIHPTSSIESEEEEFFLSVDFGADEDFTNDDAWEYAEELEEALPEFEAHGAGMLSEPPPPRGGGTRYAHITGEWNE